MRHASERGGQRHAPVGAIWLSRQSLRKSCQESAPSESFLEEGQEWQLPQLAQFPPHPGFFLSFISTRTRATTIAINTRDTTIVPQFSANQSITILLRIFSDFGFIGFWFRPDSGFVRTPVSSGLRFRPDSGFVRRVSGR